MPKESLPHPDEQAFVLLTQAAALSRRMAEAELVTCRITVAEYSLLRIMQNTPNVTASEAGKRLYASAPSVAQLVKSLERKGLMRRTQDAKDTRRQHMRLTPAGITIINRARATIQKALRKLRLSDPMLESLTRDLSTLLSSLSPYGDHAIETYQR